MRTRRNPAGNLFDVINLVILVGLIFITIYPFINMLSISVSEPLAVSSGKVVLWPIGFNLGIYKLVFKDNVLIMAYLHTILYAALSVVVSLLLTSMVSYSLSIPEFIFKKLITVIFTITMFFGGGLVPYYLLIKNLHLIDTVWVMVIPGAVSVWSVIVYRTFFQEIPGSLRESAYIDGANDFRILFRIIIPLSKPLLATMALFVIVGKWNDFFTAMIFLNKADMYPLQIVLRRLLITKEATAQEIQMMSEFNIIPTSLKAATTIVTIIPILCIYPFLQKYFTKGVMIGSLKG